MGFGRSSGSRSRRAPSGCRERIGSAARWVAEALEPRRLLSAPPVPVNFTGTGLSDSEIDLAWIATSNPPTGFELDRSLSPTFATLDRSVMLPAGAGSFQDTTVQGPQKYYYRLVALGTDGNSAPATATVSAPDHAPGNLSAAPVSATEIDLVWTDNAVAKETGFVLERAAGDELFQPYPVFPAISAGSTYFVDREPPGGSYRYRIREQGAFGTSAPSNVASASGTPEPLGATVTQLPLSLDPISSVPTDFVVSNGIGYFTANDPIHGQRLWRTDGTEDGTYAIGPDYLYPQELTDVSGTLFFDVAGGLWKSDGTSTGTILVSHHTGSDKSVLDGILYFVGTDANGGAALWRSDGTDSGTVLVKSFGPATNPGARMTVNQGQLFLIVNGTAGQAAWTSDGTAGGTVMVAPLPSGNPFTDFPGPLTAIDGRVYFHYQRNLWSSDGTVAGTQPINGDDLFTSNFAQLGANVYFIAGNTSDNDLRLWVSDGTPAGTRPITTLITWF